MQGDALFDNLLTKQTYSPADINYVIGHFITGKKPPFILLYAISREFAITELHKLIWTSHSPFANPFKQLDQASSAPQGKLAYLAYIIHSGFISGYQNRYGDNLKPPTNVYHRMTA